MKAPTGVSAMMRLKALGGVRSVLRLNLAVRGTRCGTGSHGAIGSHVHRHLGRRSWMACRTGCASGFVSMPAMRMWFARNWCEREHHRPPIRSLFRGRRNVQVLLGRVEAIDLTAHMVSLGERDIA